MGLREDNRNEALKRIRMTKSDLRSLAKQPRRKKRYRKMAQGFRGAFAGSDVTTDAASALQSVVNQYATLSAQGSTLIHILQNGGRVPCNVRVAYEKARRNYLSFGQQVFDQLASRGMTPEQVIYRDGKPLEEKPGVYKTVKIQGPLQPPSIALPAECVAAEPLLRGAAPETDGTGELGVLPVAAVLFCASNPFIAVVCIGVVAGAVYVSLQALKELRIVVRGYEPKPAETVNAYVKCVQALVAKGLTPAQAAEACVNAANQTDWTRVVMAVGVLVALGVGGYYFFKSRKQRMLEAEAS